MSPRRAETRSARAALLGAYVALLAAACGSSHSTTDGDAATHGAGDAEPIARCTVRTPVGRAGMPSGPIEAVTGGPHGTRLFTRLAWADVDSAGEFTLPNGASLAWNGLDYIVATPRGIDAYDAALAPRHARHALPARVCTPRALETGVPGEVALVYLRLVHGEACESGSGSVWFQRLGAQGALLGAPQQIGHTLEGRDRLRDAVARVDAGRVVVEFTDVLDPDAATRRYAVLALDGRELTVGDGVNVACPRAGCVRVLGRADPGARDATDTFDSRLRLAPLGRTTSFNLDAEADHVATLAVRGDRILVNYHAPSSSADDAPAWSLAVVDVARRGFDPVGDPVERTTSRTWRAGAVPSDLWSTPTGFVVASRVADEPALPRVVECQR